MRLSLALLAAALLAAAAFLALRLPAARAQAATATAVVAGVETGPSIVPELVVFNTTASALELDLRLVDPRGVVILDREAPLAVGPRETIFVNLSEEIATVVAAKPKPYAGAFTVELTGEAPFAADAVIVHVTQYFGKRTKPKGAFVIRSLFLPVP